MNVRRYLPGDMKALSRLFDAYRQFNGQESDEAAGRDFLEERLRRDESVILVAEAPDGSLAGFAQLYPVFSSVALRRVFIVNDLFVDPSCRRKGLGSALLHAAANHGREAGAIRISASTAIENTPTQILNEQVGFVKDKAFFVYHLQTDGHRQPHQMPPHD
jgi:ribosomal protein S18 acetylase RimI-like enzyme